jgi:hypothetical protein
MTDAERLASSTRGYVIAPAGCGKTELISRAVSNHALGRELILTHTHAGVDALRRRLKKMGARPGTFHIETIAGWALRYATAFPTISGQSITRPTGVQWNAIYCAAANVLGKSWATDVLRCSYSGVYVDEYQDCTIEQHNLILTVANRLPCRIVGDPLQGIFGFGNNTLVDWQTGIAPHFDSILDATTPWRWRGGCEPLGKWLQGVRASLLNGEPIDIRRAPAQFVRWRQLPIGKAEFPTKLQACKDVAKLRGKDEKIVAIESWERQCLEIAHRLSPLYTPIETIECDDLMNFAEELDCTLGIERAKAVTKFTRKCFTGISSKLSQIEKYLVSGEIKRRATQVDAQLAHLQGLTSKHELRLLLPCMESMGGLPGAILWRRELYLAMCQALREYAEGEFDTLADAAWHVRELTRRVGRSIRNRSIARTLLVKGLEFEHVVVLNADALDRENLYVALTRASHSVTILSRQPILQPTARRQ